MQSKLFNVYPTMLRKSAVWATRGNHESATNGSGVPWHYVAWTQPTAAEAGGVASGTEAYFSFNYGNIHVIYLDSFGSSRSSTGAMANWLRNDLAANTATWTIAFFHHPPYSKGSHNSDTESQLVEMRTNILPILEDGGVDLVLSGHSHAYERSFLLDGHYGTSGTLTAAMKLNGGSGREDGSGAYTKASITPTAHLGAVYAVAGSSGQTSGGTLNHPAMFISLNQLGSMVLDVDGTRLDAKFLRETGAIADYFTMLKTSGRRPAARPDRAGGHAGQRPGVAGLERRRRRRHLQRQAQHHQRRALHRAQHRPHPALVHRHRPDQRHDLPLRRLGRQLGRPGGPQLRPGQRHPGGQHRPDHVRRPRRHLEVPGQRHQPGHRLAGDRRFNDSTWASGPAELGYGDGDEATTVSYGPSSSNKYITTYFRRTFTVTRGVQLHRPVDHHPPGRRGGDLHQRHRGRPQQHAHGHHHLHDAPRPAPAARPRSSPTPPRPRCWSRAPT